MNLKHKVNKFVYNNTTSKPLSFKLLSSNILQTRMHGLVCASPEISNVPNSLYNLHGL